MKVRGTIQVPGDKSISHRALICASIATGESRISGILRSADVESTATVLRTLGTAIPELSDEFVIEGLGFGGFREPRLALQCGNSGTTARLLAGVAATCRFKSRFEGDASLSRRPMKRVAEPLTAMGARFEFEHGDGLPMIVHGADLAGIAWNTRAASAQTKSAILFAGLLGGVGVTVSELRRSRDHTERMLAALGVPMRIGETSVSLTPVPGLESLRMTIPGDPSSAAYPVALAVLADEGEVRVPGVCVNPTRTGFLNALKRMGASVRLTETRFVAGEDTATIVVMPRKLHGTRVDAADVPSMIDELPLLACVAAASGVDLEVSGAEELRVKESDRISVVVSNLRAIGAVAEERRDGFKVSGAGGPLRGKVITQGDHRIAMAFGVIGWLDGNDVEIDDRDCVSISYPGFWSNLSALVG
jgi:3-phosphoshikimate 1-carboxyvinyltransferase